MKFKDYIREETAKKPDTIVVLNGRMNPMTKGHEDNINGMLKFAKKHKADHLVIASHSHDSKKNPLTPEQKLKHLNRAFPGVNIKTSSKEHPTIFHQLSQVHSQGYSHVVLPSGADRTEDYDRIKEYNGKHGKHGYYNFKSITTESTGERQEGISGTDMRNHATDNNFKKFRENLPSNLASNEKHAKEVFNDVKAGMAPKKKVTEDYENPYRFDWGTPGGTAYMQKMTPNKKIECVTPNEMWSEKAGKCVPIREAYINNEIFRLDEIVEATNGDLGPIVFRGSTYVTMKLNDGTTVKHWLKDIKESTGRIIEKTIVEPVITYRKKFSEKRIPAILMSKEQLLEMNKENAEISYMGYKTENFDMCPSASLLFNKLIGIEKLNPKYVLQAMQATDQYLGLEKEAQKIGFADEQMIHNFTMKFSIAHDTLNMMYVQDSDLKFMQDHLKIMADLSMHKDRTFANEPASTIPVQGTSMEESVKEKERKSITMKNNYSKLRKRIQELYEPEPPTHNRDINFSDEKDVFHGIDTPIADQHVNGKPIGMVSFKTFMDDPANKKIADVHTKDRQDVHRAQVQVGQNPSAAYKQMKKAQKLEL